MSNAKAPAAEDMGRRQERDLLVVVSYDIPNDRRRLKVMKTLEGYGRRVQYSVFECRLDAETLEKLRLRLQRLVRREEDDVRFYLLCAACQRRRQGLGKGRPKAQEAHVIV